MKTSEMIDLAADEIQRRGWTKGHRGWGATGPVCIEGAIAAVANIERITVLPGILTPTPNVRLLHDCPAYVAVREYLGMRFDESVWLYNDRIAKDAEEVVAVLRAAAAVERVKEAAYAPVNVAA